MLRTPTPEALALAAARAAAAAAESRRRPRRRRARRSRSSRTRSARSATRRRPCCARGPPFQTVELNPLTKAQIGWSKAWRKVPIAVFADGEVVHDSSAIVDAILARAPPRRRPRARRSRYSRRAPLERARWATDELALYMYPNMTRTFAESRAALAYASCGARGFGPRRGSLVRRGRRARHVVRTARSSGSTASTTSARRCGRASTRGPPRSTRARRDRGRRRRAAARARAPAADLRATSPCARCVLQAAAGLALYDEIAARGGARAAEWLGAMEAALPPPVHVGQVRASYDRC